MIQNEQKEEVLKQLDEQIDFEKLTELCEHLKDAIREIFDSCGLYFRIFSRVKSQDSITNKIIRGQYGTPQNQKKLQDLIGLRIVLYYYDDLSICRDIMESTFQMMDSWSKTNYNADEFKATKINGVFRFPSEYFKLYTKEIWNLPIDTTFEIQFRTVFFEGWHEIEHDMRYKSLLSDDQFWQGSEELSRVLNCILANLELSDWSLVQLFEQLSYNHYKNMNWELMIKSHFRIKMDDKMPLDSAILDIFNHDKEIAKAFFKCSRKSLIRELLKLDNPHVTYDLIVKLLNQRTVHNEQIANVCDNLPIKRSEDHGYQRNKLSRLESNILFHLEVPLLHKEARKQETEFTNAANILYKWVRFKMNPVYDDMPEEVSSYYNHLPGYELKIVYEPEQYLFSMKMLYIDSKLVGTLWHTHSSISMLDDDQLYFYHVTSRDTPYGTAQRETFSKPSFLSDLSNKVGLTDQIRLGSKASFVDTEDGIQQMCELIQNTKRMLPMVVLMQCADADDAVFTSYRDGYDMNTFTINGTRLAKVIGMYAHVFMINHHYLKQCTQQWGYSLDQLDGGILIFWPMVEEKKPDLFTKKQVFATQFDFNRFAFHDDNIYEKAFRHKLVQIIKDDNVKH